MKRAIAAALLGVVAFGGEVAAQSRVEVGVLTCRVSGGLGFVIGSTRSLDCAFQAGQRLERYQGTIDKFGIDVGGTSSGTMTWAVLAPTDKFGPGALSGDYAGVSGEATLGVGLGANALLGGSQRSIALQPLSLQAQQGVNLALGVASLKLRSAR